jgi:hypothetical protein
VSGQANDVQPASPALADGLAGCGARWGQREEWTRCCSHSHPLHSHAAAVSLSRVCFLMLGICSLACARSPMAARATWLCKGEQADFVIGASLRPSITVPA